MTFIRGLLFSLVLFSGTQLVAQIHLTGQITDETGEALIGASVKIMQEHQFIQGVITDYEGNFKTTLTPGTYSVEISYTGFKTNRIDGIGIQAGKPVRLEGIKLEASPAGEWRGCFYYDPPLIDMNPGNTGLTIRSYEIRRRY